MKATKLNLEELLKILIEDYENGVDYIDISIVSSDTIIIGVKESYYSNNKESVITDPRTLTNKMLLQWQ
jgi:hypothetical protein